MFVQICKCRYDMIRSLVGDLHLVLVSANFQIPISDEVQDLKTQDILFCFWPVWHAGWKVRLHRRIHQAGESQHWVERCRHRYRRHWHGVYCSTAAAQLWSSSSSPNAVVESGNPLLSTPSPSSVGGNRPTPQSRKLEVMVSRTICGLFASASCSCNISISIFVDSWLELELSSLACGTLFSAPKAVDAFRECYNISGNFVTSLLSWEARKPFHAQTQPCALSRGKHCWPGACAWADFISGLWGQRAPFGAYESETYGLKCSLGAKAPQLAGKPRRKLWGLEISSCWGGLFFS